MSPAGWTFDQLKSRGLQGDEQRYKKYETRGFGTRCGNVGLFSEALQELGIDPLPVYCEPKLTRFGSPELAADRSFDRRRRTQKFCLRSLRMQKHQSLLKNQC